MTMTRIGPALILTITITLILGEGIVSLASDAENLECLSRERATACSEKAPKPGVLGLSPETTQPAPRLRNPAFPWWYPPKRPACEPGQGPSRTLCEPSPKGFGR